MKGVLIIGDSASDYVNTLVAFFQKEKQSFMVFKSLDKFVPEHFDTVIICDKSQKKEQIQKVMNLCQEKMLNVLSLFKFTKIKFPKSLNFVYKDMNKEKSTYVQIMTTIREMRETAKHMRNQAKLFHSKT